MIGDAVRRIWNALKHLSSVSRREATLVAHVIIFGAYIVFFVVHVVIYALAVDPKV